MLAIALHFDGPKLLELAPPSLEFIIRVQAYTLRPGLNFQVIPFWVDFASVHFIEKVLPPSE